MNIVQWVSKLAVKASSIPNLFGGKKNLVPCLHVCRWDKTKTFRVFWEKQFAATPLDFCHYILFCAVTRSPVSAEAVNASLKRQLLLKAP